MVTSSKFKLSGDTPLARNLEMALVLIIMSDLKLLGISIYQKKILRSKSLRIKSLDKDYTYPGLALVFENPNLEFDFVTINEEIEWKKIAFETIYYCFINLLIDGIIEIHYYEGRKTFLNGVFSYDTNNYTLEVNLECLNSLVLKDELSKEIIDSVLQVEKKNGSKQSIQKVIKHLMRKYLSKEDYHRPPEKKFLTMNLNRYTGVSWLEMLSDPKLFGLYSGYRVITDKSFSIELIEKHKKFKSLLNMLTVEEVDFMSFKNYLEFIVERQFSRSSLRGS